MANGSGVPIRTTNQRGANLSPGPPLRRDAPDPNRDHGRGFAERCRLTERAARQREGDDDEANARDDVRSPMPPNATQRKSLNVSGVRVSVEGCTSHEPLVERCLRGDRGGAAVGRYCPRWFLISRLMFGQAR